MACCIRSIIVLSVLACGLWGVRPSHLPFHGGRLGAANRIGLVVHAQDDKKDKPSDDKKDDKKKEPRYIDKKPKDDSRKDDRKKDERPNDR
ncbi:MAG: hypothetical protein NZ585_02555 [Chloracidobacterium sp.]|nr:hypothetical protein [Chloracidobacterium sp.]MDW8218750.1 hypothetical protein [Acidobacteriota bacterium]